jgi:hypothetical protein
LSVAVVPLGTEAWVCQSRTCIRLEIRGDRTYELTGVLEVSSASAVSGSNTLGAGTLHTSGRGRLGSGVGDKTSDFSGVFRGFVSVGSTGGPRL